MENNAASATSTVPPADPDAAATSSFEGQPSVQGHASGVRTPSSTGRAGLLPARPPGDRVLTRVPTAGGVLRAPVPDDLPALAALCAAHALFERSGPLPDDLAIRLGPALFDEPARLWCLVAESDGRLVGYATYTRDFSTWSASEYVHLDCLFVGEPHRGAGWGRLL
ncbi:GNAT family N-acetyltransferase, partial [Streptomyces roseolus]